MLTKEEILNLADNRLDLSQFKSEQITELDKFIGGDFAKSQEETFAKIQKGIDLFFKLGEPVELTYKGGKRITYTEKISYDPDSDFFLLYFTDNSIFKFRVAAFGALGRNGEYYGLCNSQEEKEGIKYLNHKIFQDEK